MVSRLLIGDNNLSKFWPSYQFAKPHLKQSALVTATDLAALDHALSQVEDRTQVIVSVLTTIVMEEVNQLEVENSAHNVFEQAISRLVGLCPTLPSCQVCTFELLSFVNFFVHHYRHLISWEVVLFLAMFYLSFSSSSRPRRDASFPVGTVTPTPRSLTP